MKVSNFNGKYNKINGVYDLKFNNMDLIRAVVSIGHSDWRSVFRGGVGRLYELLYYTTGTIAYINKKKGNLVLQNNFYSLDMSDKIPISYRLGMGVTKLVAEKLLDIPWLLHVDKLVSNGMASIVSGTRERGDLAGLDLNLNWHVLEAKGRSNPPSKNDVIKGKNQAGRIVTINGKVPETKSVCMSYFNKQYTETQFIDPIDGESEVPTKWRIRLEDYLIFYYKEILNEIYNNEIDADYRKIYINNKEHEFIIFSFSQYPFSIGIYLPLIKAIESYSLDMMSKLQELQSDIYEEKNKISNKSMSIGLDGIAIFNFNEYKVQ